MTVQRYYEILNEYNIRIIETPNNLETITEEEVRKIAKVILASFSRSLRNER